MENRFDDARRLQQDAAKGFSRDLCASKYCDDLWDLDARIDEAERLFAEAQLAKNEPPPPYWSVSRHLNLTKEHVDAVEQWVGRPLRPEKVLYLASAHGFESRAFHHRCNNQGPTITLVRTRTGHIFGGYASVSWSRGELKTKPPRWVPTYTQDPQAFVFRLCAPANWTGKSHDEVFEGNYTADMVEPHVKFLRDQERKGAKLYAAGHAPNATAEAKEALSGSIYEHYKEGMFWSQQNEEDFNEAPGTWPHAAAAAAAAAQGHETESGMMTDGPSGDAKQPPRWGLDVKVEGISNGTCGTASQRGGLGDASAKNVRDGTDDAMEAMTEDSVSQSELGSARAAGAASVQEWLPPVRLGQEGCVGLRDVPPLRHVWNMVSTSQCPYYT